MKSIRFKLWSGMMALVVIVLILLWLFQVVFLDSFYTGMRITNIKNEAYSIMNFSDNLKMPEIEDKLEAFAFKNNLSLELLDKTGKAVYTTGLTGSGGQMPMMRNSARVEAFRMAVSGKEASEPITHPRFGNQSMMLALPIKYADTVSRVLLLNLPLAPVEETASIIKWQLLYITLILLFASLLISYLISKSFTQPILEIKRASEIMASGDFTVRIEAKKGDEIGSLAETINYLGDQLSKIEQLRKDLIANVSHELRTPLSLIRGYAETIKDVSGANPVKREKQLEVIIEETERLTRIVNDILNLSQLQTGYIKLDKTQLSIKEILKNITEHFDVLSEESGIKIIWDSPDEIYVEADRGRIEQALYNLINNAINHTPNGGVVHVRAIDQVDKVRIEVKDNGYGIPEEDIPHIWERFYKSEKIGSRKSMGTGLGLSIVKQVLEAHKTKFGVESKVNQGSTFWFEIKKSSRNC